MDTPPAEPSAADLLGRRLREQAAELARREAEVLRGEPTGVHRTRVASRRIRAALAAYRSLLEDRDEVAAGLRWLAGELGPARDLQVVEPQVLGLVDALPPALVVGPVRARVRQTARELAVPAGARVAAAVGSARRRDLRHSVDALAAAPPYRPAAHAPAREALPPLLRHEWVRLERRVAALGSMTDRDQAAHDARKAAKRLRYALEPVEAVWGTDATRLREQVTSLTALLGERQDTVAARALLAAARAGAAAAGEPLDAYRALADAEARRAAALDDDLAGVWAATADPALRSWLG